MHNTQLNESILKIARGVYKFQKDVYHEKKQLFKALAKDQYPKILFITCSDSRIDPALITQTEPGDMFLIHNAGNIVPPHGAAYGGTGASIEYAVSVLNVEHIIVCGHSSCGAMSALLNIDSLETLPAVKHWLSFAEATRAILQANFKGHNEVERLDSCVKMNIPVQLGHLKTLPSVASRLIQGEIAIHGWLYHIETGKIDVYQALDNTFVSFEEAYPIHLVEALSD